MVLIIPKKLTTPLKYYQDVVCVHISKTFLKVFAFLLGVGVGAGEQP